MNRVLAVLSAVTCLSIAACDTSTGSAPPAHADVASPEDTPGIPDIALPDVGPEVFDASTDVPSKPETRDAADDADDEDVAGLCEGPNACDDGDPCTIDSCDPSTGDCTNEPVANDCGERECGPSPSGCYDCGVCDDDDPCTFAVCSPETGMCGPLAGLAAVAKLSAEGIAADDDFGKAVAIDGDTAVVGSRWADRGADATGLAYVYERSPTGGWGQVLELAAGDADEDACFGEDVDIDGDIIVVGAYRDSDIHLHGGSAYVFERQDGGSWLETVKLTASNGQALDRFGRNVAIDGHTIVVGAIFNDEAGDNAGAAYVFERQEDGSWPEIARLLPDDPRAGNVFGIDVAVEGDVVVVGASDDDELGEMSGSAYVFEKTDGTWTQRSKLKASHGAADDRFGYGVAVAEGLVVISAFGRNDCGTDTGAVYIFERGRSGDWGETSKLFIPNVEGTDNFGWEVATDGTHIAVAARRGEETDAGTAFVFEKQDGVWLPLVELSPAEAGAEDQFGYHVDVQGGRVIVGADTDDEYVENGGAAYVYELPVSCSELDSCDDGEPCTVDSCDTDAGVCLNEPVANDCGERECGPSPSGCYDCGSCAGDLDPCGLEVCSPDTGICSPPPSLAAAHKIMADDGASGDRLGFELSVCGDIAVLGAPSVDDNGASSGAAYLYERQHDGSWTRLQKLTADDAGGGEEFGFDVDIDGDVAVVGAFRDSDHAYRAGSVYVFERQEDESWSQVAKLTREVPAYGDNFGRGVAVSGGAIIVGCHSDDANADNAGGAFVFERQTDGSWSEAAHLLANDGVANDAFGMDVDIHGDWAIVGMTPPSTDIGAAYLFRRVDGAWLQRAKLVASDAPDGDHAFGYRVALHGDVAVVGAFKANGCGTEAGAAYVFERQGDENWVETTILTRRGARRVDWFGRAVATDGDHIVVAALNVTLSGDDGSAFVYGKQDGVWTLEGELDLAVEEGRGEFGWRVAVRDGWALVGANRDDEQANDAGAAYAYELSTVLADATSK